MVAGVDTRPQAQQLKRVSARTSALGQPSRLAARGRRGLWCAPPLLLLLLLELVWESASESPWGLPVVADGPASLAKVVMAELARLKLENKPWPGGTHSLHYHYLALSEPGPGLPQFLAVGYVDDHPFIRYDSRVGRAEPQAGWMAPVDAQYWETETRKQRAWAEVQQVETRPSGDGTYQMWAAVQVPAGEEAGYTCHVQHSGLNHTLTVAWEPPSRHGLIAMVISSILLLLAVGVVILTKRFLQARNKESYKQAPDHITDQGGVLGVFEGPPCADTEPSAPPSTSLQMVCTTKMASSSS
uniref:MHC class I-like antigen recognition-like domain-containing protein n=1 Tax=Rousettus aegyptiacus TaxID=9407 RepID=A0A7J8FJA5_ROUAE|nr:hypothetical protein HJG63_012150 [Rousettus aegyptiacus]